MMRYPHARVESLWGGLARPAALLGGRGYERVCRRVLQFETLDALVLRIPLTFTIELLARSIACLIRTGHSLAWNRLGVRTGLLSANRLGGDALARSC